MERSQEGTAALDMGHTRAKVSRAEPRPAPNPGQPQAPGASQGCVFIASAIFNTNKIHMQFLSPRTLDFKRFLSTKQLHLSSNNLFIFLVQKLFKNIHNGLPESLISRQ
jgi:hypothetical protein